MNAADVINDTPFGRDWDRDSAPRIVEGLLAEGNGQGVAILPDGTLWALERAAKNPVTLYALVPLSAEAGDTEPTSRLMEAVRSFLNDPVPKGTSLDTVQCNAAAVDELRAALSAEAGDTEQPYREMIDLAMPVNEIRLPDPDD